jgi:hypothetical protein
MGDTVKQGNAQIERAVMQLLLPPSPRSPGNLAVTTKNKRSRFIQQATAFVFLPERKDC